jgi:hypothetical protein
MSRNIVKVEKCVNLIFEKQVFEIPGMTNINFIQLF